MAEKHAKINPSINSGPPDSSELDSLMDGVASPDGYQHKIKCSRSDASNKKLSNLVLLAYPNTGVGTSAETETLAGGIENPYSKEEPAQQEFPDDMSLL
jgi:hypothetical protein